VVSALAKDSSWASARATLEAEKHADVNEVVLADESGKFFGGRSFDVLFRALSMYSFELF
jgi:hypothetical protein